MIFFKEFVLLRGHNGFQFIKSVIPHFAEWLDEVGYFFHFFCIEVIVYLPAVLLLFEQLAFGEYGQMF
jgi:hypothetical protein